MGRPELTPSAAYQLAEALYWSDGSRDPVLEAIIAGDPTWAYIYSFNVIRHPWLEAETVIMSSPGAAYRYARSVLLRPWLEAELVIASDPAFAHRYIVDVLKRRDDKARFRRIMRWAT